VDPKVKALLMRMLAEPVEVVLLAVEKWEQAGPCPEAVRGGDRGLADDFTGETEGCGDGLETPKGVQNEASAGKGATA
jgi:hypothetical protein